jgi:hypothetical protein
MTLRLSSACSNQLSYRPFRVSDGSESRPYLGGKGIRTPDIQLAKLALYQLSYAPGCHTSDSATSARHDNYLMRKQKLNCALLKSDLVRSSLGFFRFRGLNGMLPSLLQTES